MSTGLLAIRAILDNMSRDTFRHLRDAMFTDDERPAWNFVTTYFDRYGTLPSVEVCAEQGFWLPPAPGAVGYYRDALRDRAIYQVYVREQQTLLELMQSGRMMDFVSLLSSILTEMQATSSSRDTYTMAEALQLVMEDFEEARAAAGPRGILYGWPSLDDATGGARAGDLVSVVARPGLGKSFTLMRMACMAWAAGCSVAFVSNEMGAVEMARRTLAMGSGVNSDFIQRGHVSDWGEEQLRATLARVPDMPPFQLLIGDLSKSVRDVDALVQEHDPDVIYVDAGYLMRPSKDRGMQKRFEMASEAMRELKGLATGRSKPLVQTVQFNRGQKPDEEMSLDNIGQTDEVGQLSSLVLGMRRGAAPHEQSRRRYSVIKNRHGADGFSFETLFEHSPFCMDEIEETGDGTDENGDWDGVQGAAPARDEWT